MTEIIPQVVQSMRSVLGSVADEAGRETGFVQRQRKLTGGTFVQTLVFGWLASPQASLEELAQMAVVRGVEITPQGLDQRFTPEAAECLKQVLAKGVQQLVAAAPVAIPILQRFQGVYVLDSSVIRLPDALAEDWPGCGGRIPEGLQASLKLEVRLNLSTGALEGPFLQPGRVHDRCAPVQTAPLPKGALRLADLGYFSLDNLAALDREGVYWLSRMQMGTVIFDQDGRRWHLAALLESVGQDEVDLLVTLGARRQVQCRLLAVRVPQEVAEQRRRRLRDEARRRQQGVSQERMTLTHWTVFITNAPAELLSLPEALILARARWQIELLFKLWKSHGQIDKWRSANPWRILCELYAKLLTMIIQHWVLLVGCWAYPNRSLFKAAQTIQKHALSLAVAFDSVPAISEAIAAIQRCLAAGCRINKRKTKPHTYQLLLSLTERGLT